MAEQEINPRSKGGLPLSTQMEQFSRAYLRALTSANGYQLDEPDVDYQSIDATIKSATLIDNAKIPDPAIDVQLKATTQDIDKGDHLTYKLSIKNYDDLRCDTRTQRILLLLIVPNNPDSWVIHGEKTLLDAKCYYKTLTGEKESSNTACITIKIPKTNIFTKDVLHELMCKIANGEQL